MGAAELAEWAAFYELEPFGPRRDNVHAGIIASVVANVNRDRSSKALTPADFLIEDPQEARERRTREAINSLMRLATPRGSDG